MGRRSHITGCATAACTTSSRSRAWTYCGSRKSWNIVIPTIRKPGSEIWASFNPELETDETYQRFVAHPPEGAVVVKTSYRDNPYLSNEIKQDMADLKAR